MVNYNNSQLSIDCYNSLVSQKKDINLTLIVVDNNSSEKEKNILRAFQTKYMDFEVLYLDSNIGYFPGMAKGQEYAYKKGEYDFMIIANNDLIYSPDFMGILSTIKESNNVMVICPDIVTRNGIHQNPHFVNKISSIRKFFYYFYYSNWYVSLIILYLLRLLGIRRREKNKPGYETEQFIYIGFGACLILTKSFMDKIKLVDTRSFLMGEELLLTLQVDKIGGGIKYIPRLKVTHLDSATFKKFPTRFAFECEKKAFNLYKRNILY